VNQFSTRKIVSGLVLLGVGVLVTYWKGDIPTNLGSLMQTLYYGFIAGNAFEHFTVMKTPKETNESQNPS